MTDDAASRAAVELRRSSTSRCGACGRDTKTVEGVCADCWEPKEPGARVMRPTPRRTPFFDLDVDPIWGYLALAVAAGVAAKLLWALLSGL